MNLSNRSGVCIDAAKPGLLAQIQAIRLQEALAATDATLSAAPHKQQADNQQISFLQAPRAMAPGEMPLILDPQKALQQQMLLDILAIQ